MHETYSFTLNLFPICLNQLDSSDFNSKSLKLVIQSTLAVTDIFGTLEVSKSKESPTKSGFPPVNTGSVDASKNNGKRKSQAIPNRQNSSTKNVKRETFVTKMAAPKVPLTAQPSLTGGRFYNRTSFKPKAFKAGHLQIM